MAATSPKLISPSTTAWSFSVTRRHGRSEEHTSELQSRLHLVCRLLLEKNKPAPRSYTARAIRGFREDRTGARRPGPRPSTPSRSPTSARPHDLPDPTRCSRLRYLPPAH